MYNLCIHALQSTKRKPRRNPALRLNFLYIHLDLGQDLLDRSNKLLHPINILHCFRFTSVFFLIPGMGNFVDVDLWRKILPLVVCWVQNLHHLSSKNLKKFVESLKELKTATLAHLPEASVGLMKNSSCWRPKLWWGGELVVWLIFNNLTIPSFELFKWLETKNQGRSIEQELINSMVNNILEHMIFLWTWKPLSTAPKRLTAVGVESIYLKPTCWFGSLW